MSHELRTPLNAIIGYSEMLQEDAGDHGFTEGVSDLKKIHASGKHLLELINDILDLAKIEAGKMEVHAEEFRVDHLVHEVATIIQPLLKVNANALHSRCHPEVGTMFSDATKIRQGLYNLLSNACKFTTKGKIDIQVQREGLQGREWIMFHVRDNGIGMTKAQQEHIFEAFSQGDSSTTRKYGGTGLGLAITKNICQLLGGEIQVHSQTGKGSTFTMKIPARLPSVVPSSLVHPVHDNHHGQDSAH